MTVSVSACSVATTHMEAGFSCPLARHCEVKTLRRSSTKNRSSVITESDSDLVSSFLFRHLPFADPYSAGSDVVVDGFLRDARITDADCFFLWSPFSFQKPVQPLSADSQTPFFNHWRTHRTTLLAKRRISVSQPSVEERSRIESSGDGFSVFVSAVEQGECHADAQRGDLHLQRTLAGPTFCPALLPCCCPGVRRQHSQPCGPACRPYMATWQSMTYNNHFVVIPARDAVAGNDADGSVGGGILSAVGRARALAHLRLSVGDVQGASRFRGRKPPSFITFCHASTVLFEVTSPAGTINL